MSHDIEPRSDSATDSAAAPKPRPWSGIASDSAAEPLRDERPGLAHRRPSKADPVPVRPGLSVAEGLATIVAACLGHYRRNEPLVIAARNEEALHQSRVAMRRLRSAISLFKPVIGDARSAQIKAEIRWFSCQLGDARNLDVYLARELDPGKRVLLEEKREAAYDSAIRAMKSERFRQLLFDLAAWSAAGEWRLAARTARRLEPFANRRIDRLWSRVAAVRGLRRMSGEERHRLRIEVKRLRYAVEFVAALHSSHRKRQKRFGNALEDLQEELGLLNDIAVAARFEGKESGFGHDDERRHLNRAARALRELRSIGPYWSR